jgi:hypothetical protein
MHSLVAIQVPLADVGGFVAGTLVRLGEGNRLIPEQHIIQEDAVSQGVLARQQTGAVRAANGTARHSVLEIHTLVGQAIQVGRPHVPVAGVARSLGPPLVGKDVDHAGLSGERSRWNCRRAQDE